MTAPALELNGVVTSGQGEGTGFTALPWVVGQFRAKLGYVPFPGTFNLHMSGTEWERARARMQRSSGIGIEPPPGFCAAKCFSAELAGGLPATIVLPDIENYPSDKLEILAAVSVRGYLGLRDGDPLRLTLVVE